MADLKISALPSASTISGGELVPVVQAGTTKQTTIAAIGAGITSIGGALTITSGNLGLGVVPSAWTSGYRVLQIQQGSLVQTGGFTVLANNYFDDGTAKYVASDFASHYIQVNGQHRWSTAPSGTAGAAITFTQAMTLDASGNLGVGTATATARLEAVAGTGTVTTARFRTGDSTAANNAGALFYATSSATANNRNAGFVLDADGANGSGGDYFVIQKDGNDGIVSLNQVGNAAMALYTANIERARVKSTGQLRFVPLAADPAGAETGDVYYNSSTNKLRVYNGAWVDLH